MRFKVCSRSGRSRETMTRQRSIGPPISVAGKSRYPLSIKTAIPYAWLEARASGKIIALVPQAKLSCQSQYNPGSGHSRIRRCHPATESAPRVRRLGSLWPCERRPRGIRCPARHVPLDPRRRRASGQVPRCCVSIDVTALHLGPDVRRLHTATREARRADLARDGGQWACRPPDTPNRAHRDINEPQGQWGESGGPARAGRAGPKPNEEVHGR
jgi:hypothetical protein